MIVKTHTFWAFRQENLLENGGKGKQNMRVKEIKLDSHFWEFSISITGVTERGNKRK